jgi:hypothetical protein
VAAPCPGVQESGYKNGLFTQGLLNAIGSNVAPRPALFDIKRDRGNGLVAERMRSHAE